MMMMKKNRKKEQPFPLTIFCAFNLMRFDTHTPPPLNIPSEYK